MDGSGELDALPCAWHPTRLPGFIFSDLIFAGKDKTHHLSSHESFPPTQHCQHRAATPCHASDAAPSGARTHTKAHCAESNKGTCKPQLVLPLTIRRVAVCFGIKGFLCALEETNKQP